MTGDEREEATRLLAEKRRLRDITPTADRNPRDGTDEIVKLFANLFRSREDAYRDAGLDPARFAIVAWTQRPHPQHHR